MWQVFRFLANRHTLFRFIALVLFPLVLTSVFSNCAQKPEKKEGTVIEQAKQEGKLSWYTSAPAEASSRFLDAFEKKYPFIKTSFTRSGTFATIEKYRSELRAGKVKADVMHVLDVGIYLALKEEGNLLKYDSKEYAHYPDIYKDDGYWVALRTVSICMAYNSEALSEEEAPKRWKDLVDPKWKGEIGLEDARIAGSQYAQYYALKKRLGEDFWKGLAAQEPRFAKSSGALVNDLLTGEIKVAGELVGYRVYQSQKEGAPIKGVWPEEGVPIIIAPLAILAQSPHPNAARLFIDFALSKEGQTLFQELVGAYSMRPDVEPLEGKPKLSELNQLTPASWSDYLEEQEKLREEFAQMFGLE